MSSRPIFFLIIVLAVSLACCTSGQVEQPDGSDADGRDGAPGPGDEGGLPNDSGDPGIQPSDGGAADAGQDAGLDAGSDPGPEDAGVDAGSDAGTDAGDGSLPTCSTQGQDCSPGPGQGTADQCFDLPAMFKNQATAAVQQVLNDHPEYFDFNQGYPCCPLATNPDGFVLAVVSIVNGDGLCCIRDPNDGNEIVIKLNNDCAENYGLLTSGSLVRNPPKFQGTCAPAWF